VALMINRNNNGATPIWPTITTTAVLVSLLVGAQWAISQTQLASISKEIENTRKDAQERALALNHEQERRETELKSQIDRLRLETTGLPEFKQFESRVLDKTGTFEKQLNILESTRPTTGELSGMGKATDMQLARQEERIRWLEQYLLQKAPLKQ
jgi:hypothetical protein